MYVKKANLPPLCNSRKRALVGGDLGSTLGSAFNVLKFGFKIQYLVQNLRVFGSFRTLFGLLNNPNPPNPLNDKQLG
jgi:hypothetical protein